MRISLKEHHGITDVRTILLNELQELDGYQTLLTEDFLDEGFFQMVNRALMKLVKRIR